MSPIEGETKPWNCQWLHSYISTLKTIVPAYTYTRTSPQVPRWRVQQPSEQPLAGSDHILVRGLRRHCAQHVLRKRNLFALRYHGESQRNGGERTATTFWSSVRCVSLIDGEEKQVAYIYISAVFTYVQHTSYTLRTLWELNVASSAISLNVGKVYSHLYFVPCG